MAKAGNRDPYAALRTHEAKAEILFNLVGRSLQAVSHEVPITEIELEIPKSLHEGGRIAVERAFREQRFRDGFFIADRCGLLDKISKQIQDAPAEKPSGLKQFPDEVRSLPGFGGRGSSFFDEGRDWELANWVMSLNHSLVSYVLLPRGEYEPAVNQLLKLGKKSEAINVAANNLTLERAAEICEGARAGFPEVIRLAKQKGRTDLETKLQAAHINSIKDGSNADARGPRRWEDVLVYAQQYGISEEAQQQIVYEGVESLVGDIKTEIGKWQSQLREVKDRRYGPTRNEVEARADSKLEHELEQARDHVVERPTETVRQLASFMGRLPTQTEEQRIKAEELKKQAYEACKPSGLDTFSLAHALHDKEKMFEIGMHFVWQSGVYSQPDSKTRAIKHILEREVLPGDEGKIKKYVESQVDGDSDSARRVAMDNHLGDWLINLYEAKNKPVLAASVAESMQQVERAKNLYVQARCYDHAIRLSSNPAEQAAFTFAKLQDSITNRLRGGLSYHEKQNEVSLMRRGIGLAKPSDRTDVKYIQAVTRVVITLFEKGDFTEAILFAEAAGVERNWYSEDIPKDALVRAEINRDFTSCYHVARVLGDRAAAGTYRTILTQAGTKIPRTLDQFCPPPQPADPHDMPY